jgi:hypothetical protein
LKTSGLNISLYKQFQVVERIGNYPANYTWLTCQTARIRIVKERKITAQF